MIGLWREKEDTNTRINKRIDEMFDEGLIDEVQ
jgi:tRNA A37 N6-isopentenylltransferase MiaA